MEGERRKEWIMKKSHFTFIFQRDHKRSLRKRGEVQSRAEGLGHGEGRRGRGSARRKETRMAKGGGTREGSAKLRMLLASSWFKATSTLLHPALCSTWWTWDVILSPPLPPPFSGFHVFVQWRGWRGRVKSGYLILYSSVKSCLGLGWVSPG